MMTRTGARWMTLGVFSAVLLLLAGLGCAKKDYVVPDWVDVDIVDEDLVPEVKWDEIGEEPFMKDPDAVAARLRNVHFDFDRYNLKPEARQVLRENYALLRDVPRVQILVEGHCDNRGTVEYNLALGQRRADAVSDYLISLGMPAARIRTISYGLERPLDPRNNEAAWALNRRAEFKILSR